MVIMDLLVANFGCWESHNPGLSHSYLQSILGIDFTDNPEQLNNYIVHTGAYRTQSYPNMECDAQQALYLVFSTCSAT